MAKGKARADLNKLQAVREVLDEKGKSIVPLEIQKIIKSKHGVELPTGLIQHMQHHVLVKADGFAGAAVRDPPKPASRTAGDRKN